MTQMPYPNSSKRWEALCWGLAITAVGVAFIVVIYLVVPL